MNWNFLELLMKQLMNKLDRFEHSSASAVHVYAGIYSNRIEKEAINENIFFLRNVGHCNSFSSTEQSGLRLSGTSKKFTITWCEESACRQLVNGRPVKRIRNMIEWF